MLWWQIALIALGTIGAGIITGIFAFYSYYRFIKKRETTFFGVLALLFTGKDSGIPLTIDGEQDLTVSQLIAEIERNVGVAPQSLGEKLQPLETRVWDASQHEFEGLPEKLRKDLQKVYSDIRMVNSIVWLSTELGRQTPDLENNYLNLCASINEGLGRIKEAGWDSKLTSKQVRQLERNAQQEARDRARKEAEEAREHAKKKAELERLLSTPAGTKRDKRAEREAEKEAKQVVKEREKREAEEAKERVKREAEEAKKAQQEAREREKREAEEAKERVKREAEEAKKAQEDAREREKREAEEAKDRAKKEVEGVAGARLYEGRIRLSIMSPVDFRRLRKLEECLREVPDLRLAMVGGSVDEGTTIVVFTEKPLPLVKLLKEMPPVEQVIEEDKRIQVKLRAEEVKP